MSIETKFLDDRKKIALVTLTSIPEMKFGASIFELGQDLLGQGVTTLIFDLVDAVYIPMDGLGMLNSLVQQVSTMKGSVVVVCHNPNLKMLLNSTTLARVIKICNSVEEALESETGATSIDSFLNSLNEEQKFWYLCALANMIVADGEISTDEVSAAETMFEHIELAPEQAAQVQNVFQSLAPIPLSAMHNISRETGETILQMLALIAISDGALAPQEEEVLRQVGSRLGFKASTAENTIQWARQQLLSAKS